MSKTTVRYDMLEHYIVDMKDSGVCVEVKPWISQPHLTKIFDIIYWFFPSVIMASGAIFFICISRDFNFYSVAFSICSLLLFTLQTVIFVNKVKCSNKYKVAIDSRGVIYGNSKATFFISWEKVKSFGIVNKVRRASPYLTNKYDTYSCIYISKVELDKFLLRKKFQKQLSRYIELRNTEEFMLLAFLHNCNENSEILIYEKLRDFILHFTDNAKEINDIEI